MTWLGLICRQLLVLEGEVCTLLPRGTFPASWAVREIQNLILYVSEVRPLLLVPKTGLPPLGPLPVPPTNSQLLILPLHQPFLYHMHITLLSLLSFPHPLSPLLLSVVPMVTADSATRGSESVT